MSVRRYLLLFALVVWGFSIATAQSVQKSHLELSFFTRALTSESTHEGLNHQLQEVSVCYENNKHHPRWDYKNNQATYDILVEAVKELASGSHTLRTIVIEGAASPLGSEEYNKALALRRAETLKAIISQMEGGDKLHIHTLSSGEDWDTFKSCIEEQYNETNRTEVLAILSSGLSNDDKERALQALDQCKTWQLLVDRYMDTARNAAVIRIVEVAPLVASLSTPSLQGEVKAAELVLPIARTDVAEVTSAPSQTSVVAEQTATTETITTPYTPTRYPVVALRSNLLVPALNVGVEVPIGNHWSVGADYYYPWVWPKRDNKDCFEFLGWGIEARYWFGRNRTIFDRLQGHSVGLYGYMGYYDFERNFHGYQGEFANIGLDYTYAMAVGKRKQVHFEFSLGVGFIHSQARKYSVIESGSPLISEKITKMVNFFGPTKANISLVVPIFQSVKPNDKNRGDE